MYHQGKGSSEDELRNIKKRLICKTLTQQGTNALKEAYRKGFVVASPYLVNHLVELRLLKHQSTLSSVELGKQSVDVDAIYELTGEGKKLTEKWGLS